MKNKVFLAVGLVVLLTFAGLAGCSAARVAAADVQPVSVNVNSQQGIWVTGEGKITVTPDIALIYVGVSATAPKVTDAQTQAAAAMDKVMSALTSNGIDKKDIQTQYYSIQQITNPVIYPTGVPDGSGTIPPVAPPTPQDVPNVSGSVAPRFPPTPTMQTEYQVSNQVTVTIRTVANAGPVIDAVAAAGGDNIRINGINFSVDKPAQYNVQMRDLAMQDAKAKAADLARLSGVNLGKATYISENSYSQPVPYPMAMYKSADMAGSVTSISPGQTDLTLTVQVAYAIQ
jgi:uncharacterized protein YggE